MKKSLSILLTLAMIITAFSVPVMVSADEVTEPEVYYYNDFTDALGMTNAISNTASADYAECFAGIAVSDDGETVAKFYNVSENARSPKWTLDSTIKPGEEVDLAFEFRIRLRNPRTTGIFDRYFSTWGAGSITAHKNSERTIAIYNSGKYKNGVRWSTKDTSVIEGIELDEEAWNTFTIIYSASEEKLYRELYVNGVYAGKSPEGADENKYAAKGSLNPVFLPCLLPDDIVEMDYLKVYEYTAAEDFTAQLEAAADDGIVVKFSGAPANISRDMFSLSDGTAISKVSKINENLYKLIPESKLIANEAYTLSISDALISTLGKALSASSFEFIPESSVYIDEGTLPYFNTFAAGTALGSEFASTTNDEGKTVTVENDNTLKLYSEGTKVAETRFTPDYTNTSEDRQPLVLEYRVKFDSQSTSSYLSHQAGQNSSNKYTHGIQIYPYKSTNQAHFSREAAVETFTLDGDLTEWHTVSIVYSASDNKKELYWDGKYKGTSTSEDNYSNIWDTEGKLGTVRFYHTAGKADMTLTTCIDYLKVYEAPEVFGAQILNPEATELNEITLDFNSTVNLSAGALRVNGKAPESITLLDEAEQTYKVTLAETLRPETTYELSFKGVTNMVGQTTYSDLSFTTRALTGNEIYYITSGSGVVKTADGEIANGTFSEAGSHTLTVKPNKGYEAVVKVNGEAVEESTYATYDITVSDGALVEVSFTALEAEEEISFISIPYIFTEGNTSYTFARINKSLSNKSYGVIVSEDKTEPVVEDVNGETTFKFPAIRGTNKYGEFGIGIKDNAEGKLGNKYYVRPYAVSEGTYYYGTPVEVNK